MKKITFALLLLSPVSSQKVSAQSIADKLPGSWTVTQIAMDMNGNNQLDKKEQEDVSALGFYFILNGDGTGLGRMDIFTTRDNRFRWNTANNGTQLNIMGEGNADIKLLFYKLADGNSSLHVDKISGNTMQLSTNEGGMMWLTLKRK